MDPVTHKDKPEENKNKNKNDNMKYLKKDKIENKKQKKNKEGKNKNLRIYSYNSRGFDQIKQQVCRELMNLKNSSIPVLCNQGNFVLKGNAHFIQQALPDCHVFIKPAKKSRLEGRPINGMFIAIPDKFRTKAKDVSPINERVQGVVLNTDDGDTLIVNAYFPSDPKTITYNHDEDLENVLAAIENLIETQQCNSVLIVGDLNADYKRKNGRIYRLNKFLTDNDMDLAWKEFEVDYTHEFEKDGITYTSTIDHVVWNTELRKKVVDSGVLHVISNTSDHSPLYCDLMKALTSEGEQQLGKEKKDGVNIKALDEMDWDYFNKQLDEDLSTVAVPRCIDCKDVNCKNEKHIQEIDAYTKEVLGVLDRSIQSIAKTKRSNIPNAKVVPGWSEIVQPFSNDAKFWNAVWISAGKPMNTALHLIMKRTRNRYHFAIRKCKRASEKILKDKMLMASVTGKDNIFEKIHKMRKVKNLAPTYIDGMNNPAERFAEVYGTLYNSTNDREDMEAMSDEVESSITEDAMKDVQLVTPTLIEKVVREIKSSKNDPIFTFNSDCIKKAPSSFYHHIAKIIRAFLVHGHVSDILLVATIVPLLKDKLGNVEASDNYRSIALSSVILKIFDWVVMTLFEDRLELDDLQFSYQKKCSTNMCTWMVVEGINYFSRNNSDIYACFMDMKKAFDMVKHTMLFRKLIERNVPPIYLRLLIVMYMAQTAKVRWNGVLSESFSISNGVKQGAVLSAILFCIYINDLIKELRRKGDGCWMNNEFIGIIVYADDIALLSPSLDGLQNMVDTCTSYAKVHNLTFSTHEIPSKSKTKCMAFLKTKRDLKKLQLDGKPLPWVDSVKHLGTTLTNNKGCCLEQDLIEKRAQYIAKNNELCQEFYYTHSRTKTWINNIYNTSFYGAPLWDMFSKTFERLEKTWNVSMRQMLCLPRNTHRYLIEPLSEIHHIRKSLWRRFSKFVRSIEDGKKRALRWVLQLVKQDVRSTTGKNLRNLMLKATAHSGLKIEAYTEPYKAIPTNEMWRIPLVNEILESRNGGLTIDLSKEEIGEFTDYVCGE